MKAITSIVFIPLKNSVLESNSTHLFPHILPNSIKEPGENMKENTKTNKQKRKKNTAER